jgi:hypothetical protein
MASVLDVMQIEPDAPATAGHGAAVTIPGKHVLALARCHGRGGPLWDSGVQGAEVDRVARG